MADETSPPLLRQELGARLRELRRARGLTVEDVAGRLLCSPSKVSRMETGQRGASQRDVRDLVEIYQVEDPDTREELMALAKGARQRRTVQLGEGADDPEYLDLESTATSITVGVSSILPALFQTRDYARAQWRGRAPDVDADWIEQRIRSYDLRQKILTRQDPPKVLAFVDEAALRRQVGGPETMRAQLDRLLRIVSLPNVQVRVLPFTAGAHVAAESSFAFLEFEGSRVPAIVYFEGLAGQRSLKRREDIERYRNAINHLKAAALGAADSAALLSRIRDTDPGCDQYDQRP